MEFNKPSDITVTYHVFISELGDGWAPTILDNTQEFIFLKQAMRLFLSSYDHPSYIGGSARFINYLRYTYIDFPLSSGHSLYIYSAN